MVTASETTAQPENLMMDFYKFIFHYINEEDPLLLREAIDAIDNQTIQPESAGKGGDC